MRNPVILGGISGAIFASAILFPVPTLAVLKIAAVCAAIGGVAYLASQATPAVFIPPMPSFSFFTNFSFFNAGGFMQRRAPVHGHRHHVGQTYVPAHPTQPLYPPPPVPLYPHPTGAHHVGQTFVPAHATVAQAPQTFTPGFQATHAAPSRTYPVGQTHHQGPNPPGVPPSARHMRREFRPG